MLVDKTNRSRPMWILLLRETVTDILEAAVAWPLWSKFAWHDMLARYRRSWIGPIWLVLSAVVLIGALSLVYGTLFQLSLENYVPFVSVGIVTWNFISAVTSESSATFVESEIYIRQVRTSLFIYVFRVIWRNVLVFFHQFVVVLVVLVLFGKLRLSLLPHVTVGLLLLFVQALWVVPLLGLIGTRFRDLQPIIANLLQLLFFVTPVFWTPSLLGSRQWVADINPLSSLIAVLRQPLLGEVATLGNYIVVISMTICGLLLMGLIYGRFRMRVIYWL